MIPGLTRKGRRLRPSQLGPTVGSLGGRSLGERIASFQSLGGNCEFGFVQRYCGVEPSGLFRFAYTDIEPLTHAIADGLEKYGAPGDLRLEDTESGIYYCVSACYNFWYNTQRMADTVDRAAFLEDQYGRVAHLKRTFLRDLATGAKILVRKPQAGEDRAAFINLAEAVWRHGPTMLLRVTESVSEGTSLHRTSERLMEGTLAHVSPPERNYETDLESWIRLCDAAYAEQNGLAPEPGPPHRSEAPSRRPAPKRHDTRLPGHVLNSFTELVDPGAFDPAAIYVYSAWVWIPAAFSGSRLFAMMGMQRLGWRDADLDRRECWQRVWAAGRPPLTGEDRPSAGLSAIGGPGEHFWSWGHELREGPIPAPAEAPTVTVPPSLVTRLLGR